MNRTFWITPTRADAQLPLARFGSHSLHWLVLRTLMLALIRRRGMCMTGESDHARTSLHVMTELLGEPGHKLYVACFLLLFAP
jgi:hypothetical protein